MQKIRNSLDVGNVVKIFALLPESSLQYYALDVDLVKGLENPLIALFSPEWNIHG